MLTPSFLSSRLSAPRPGRYVVDNPRLDDWIAQCEQAAVVVLIAPAGFGKTTTMVALYQAELDRGRRARWIHLCPDDNQIERFCELIAGACELGPLLAADARPDPLDPSATGRAMRRALLAGIEGSESPLALFLDDFEQLDDSAVVDLVQQAIERLPSGSRVYLSSRRRPALRLLKWKTEGRLLEIGAQSLTLDHEQARTLLNQRHHIGLDDASVSLLLARTEGWAAGLQLVALALSERSDPRGFLNQLSLGARDDIGHYLYEEVFATQTEDLQRFLLDTGQLDQLTPALCDAVRGASDSARLLRRVDQLNLFISQLNDEQGSFRYHALFRDFLRGKMAEEAPERAVAIKLAAARWYAEHGETGPAIALALEAKDYELACTMLSGEVWQLVARGELSSCARWLHAIPTQSLDCQPHLLAALGWVEVFRHEFEKARRIALHSRDLPGAAAITEFRVLEALTLAATDDLLGCERLLDGELRDARLGDVGGLTLDNARAYIALTRQRFEDSQTLARQAAHGFELMGSDYGLAYSYGILAHALLATGRAREAREVLQAAYSRVSTRGVDGNFSAAHVAAYLAEAWYELGAGDRAADLAFAHLGALRETGFVDTLVIAYRVLARQRCAIGAYADAAEIVTQGLELGHQLTQPRLVAALQLEGDYRLAHMFDHGMIDSLPPARDRAEVWDRFEGMLAPSSDAETLEVSAMRHSIRSGRAAEVIDAIGPARAAASAVGRRRLDIKLGVLQAHALSACGQRAAAEDVAHSLAPLLEESGLVATVLEEGPAAAEVFFADRPEFDAMVQAFAPLSGVGVVHDELSTRESDVVRCVAQGMPNKRIAQALHISETTVKFHLRNISAKLGARNRTEIVFICKEHGLLGAVSRGELP